MNTEHQEQPKAIPRIYVASLADYNSGRLVGKWIDATQEADAIHEEIREMLKQSREPIAEEWAIHDYEGFLGLNIEEYSSMENVAAAAKLVVEHGQLFAELVNHFGGLQHIEEAQQYLSEGYRGTTSTTRESPATWKWAAMCLPLSATIRYTFLIPTFEGHLPETTRLCEAPVFQGFHFRTHVADHPIATVTQQHTF
jgi:hypothetical protein